MTMHIKEIQLYGNILAFTPALRLCMDKFTYVTYCFFVINITIDTQHFFSVSNFVLRFYHVCLPDDYLKQSRNDNSCSVFCFVLIKILYSNRNYSRCFCKQVSYATCMYTFIALSRASYSK